MKKALSAGKNAQEMVKDILLKALPESKERLHYQQLNPKENGYIIHSEEVATTLPHKEQKLFSHVDDTEKFVACLRKNVWRKS